MYIFSILGILEGWGARTGLNNIRGLRNLSSKLEEKLNEVKEEQQNIRECNLYIEAYKRFHKYDDVDVLTDDELE